MTAFWNYFIYFAVVAVLLWAAGACAAWKDRNVVAYSATIAGLVVFFSYILIMWISLTVPQCVPWARHVCGILSSCH